MPIKGKPLYSKEIIDMYRKKLLIMSVAINSNALRLTKSLHFEALKGDKKGLYSIRVNKQYRLEFKIEKDLITLVEIVLIENLSNHYK